MSRILLSLILGIILAPNLYAQDEPWVIDKENIEGFILSSFANLKSDKGLILDLVADQVTTRVSGNFVPGFRRFASEPRRDTEFENRLNFSILRNEQFFILHFIQQIEDEGKTIEGFDESQMQSVLATLYLTKGLGLGFLGLLHDNSVILDRNTDYQIENSWGFSKNVEYFNLQFEPYQEVVKAGISDIERALAIVDQMENEGNQFELPFLKSPIKVDAENFRKIAYSMIAKLLISTPRDKSEIVDYERVLAYAEKGLDNDYPNILFTSNNPLYLEDRYFIRSNYLQSCDLESESDCSGDFQTDVKVLHLLDSTYAKTYPKGSIEFEPIEKIVYRKAITDDPRLAYFNYTTRPGGEGHIFFEHNLYSNYYSLRNYYGQDWSSENYPFILMINAELQYIIAECYFNLGDLEKANQALQNSPYGTEATDLEIDLPAVQLGVFPVNGYVFNGPDISANAEAFTKLLHKEYSVELSTLTTMGTHLFFMRRNNLLQMYSPLQYPSEKMELSGEYDFTYGGRSNFGKEGTSSGLGAWRKNTALLIPSFGKSQVENEKIKLTWHDVNYAEIYPEEELPILRLSSKEANLDTTFLANDRVTEFELGNLENGKKYKFYIEAFSEYRENSLKDSITVTPNTFGLNSTKEDIFYTALRTSQAYNTINFFNYSDNELVVDSVRMEYDKSDTTLYSEFSELFEFEREGFKIPPMSEYRFGIVFRSNLWAEAFDLPLAFTFFSSKGDVTYTYSRFMVSTPSGDFPKWLLLYSAQDSLSLGQVSVGETDSIRVQVRNMSLRNIYIDSLYIKDRPWSIAYNDINNNEHDSDVFFFKQPNERVEIKPYEWHSFWLFATPKTNENEDVYGFIQGDLSSEYNGIGHFYVNQGEKTVVSNEPLSNLPKKLELEQNYPNPFNPSTVISYQLPVNTQVELRVFDMLGREVKVLLNEQMPAGYHKVHFNAGNLASGMYIYRLKAGSTVITKKLMLIK